MLVETDVLSVYDEVIKRKLKVDIIPRVSHFYELGKSISIHEDDLYIFQKLFPVTPPKKKKKIGTAGSKAVGNGELALYWLFKYQKEPHTVSIKKGKGNPDLEIDGFGVEIKSIDKNKITVGRIGRTTHGLNDLNVVLGINALITEFKSKGNKLTPPNAFNVDVPELLEACDQVYKLYNQIDYFNELSDVFGINFISSLTSKLENLQKTCPSSNKEELAANLLRPFIHQKLSTKPGFPGYIVNVSEEGEIEYIYIDENKVYNISDDAILNNVSLKQGTLVFAFDLFK